MAHPKLTEENFAARLDLAATDHLQREEFQRKFPPITRLEQAPVVTWAEIERQLTFLSGSEQRRWEVEVLRKQSQTMPPEYFLQQLLILGWAIIDDAPDTAAAMRGRLMD